jgi:hypothetical protein
MERRQNFHHGHSGTHCTGSGFAYVSRNPFNAIIFVETGGDSYRIPI